MLVASNCTNIDPILRQMFTVELIQFVNVHGPLSRANVRSFIWSLYNELLVFVFGALSSQFLTDIAKYSIGRLRPHFIDVCRPRNFASICPSEPNYRYVEDFECTNENERQSKESRLSFMSGHSSFSAYSMVYVAVSSSSIS